MPRAETWTVGRLLEWTATFLRERGSETPRLDSEVMLAEALGCERIDLYTSFDRDPGDEVRTAFRELVRRRAEGMPVAYLVGHREFYSLPFRVTSAVLIPRPETEFVVITLLDVVKDRPQGAPPAVIADVGTGSGVLAVCAALHVPNARVTAIDISPAALEIARANAQSHAVADRIKFVESDLFSAAGAEQFDYIVSNPPYVTSAEMDALPVDVRNYEPHQALDGGPTGAEIIERLAHQAEQRLVSGGYFICEISPMLKSAVASILAASEHWEPCQFVNDLAGLTRVVKARRK